MTSHLRYRHAAIPLAALMSVGVAGVQPTAASSHTGPTVVHEWNGTAGEVALASCLSPGNDPLHESRMYAMTSLAVHDALNAIDRRYRTYASSADTIPGASVDAAVAAAARAVLVSAVEDLPADLFGGCVAGAIAVADSAYQATLDDIPDGPAEDAGVAVGEAAADEIIALRMGDGSDTPLIVGDYEQGTEPGEWRFTPDRPFAFAPGWADVRPFALKGRAAFNVAPHYPLGSAAYARDFEEVKALGSAVSTARTPDQTQAALFWVESSPLQWNRIARTVSVDQGQDPWEAARLFALLNMGLADGYIASWAVKYDDPFWRPVTAIREADTDGNPRTGADPTWTPLDTTPPIPDHDSAHSVQGAAAATVMAAVFGSDRIGFSSCSLTLPDGQQCDDATPVERDFDGFWQAAQQNADSRVWVGYHFRHASEVGLIHGRQVARLVMGGMLTAAPAG